MKINKFINEVRDEMKYVKWPTRKMVMGSTLAVILISVSVGAYLGVLDHEFKLFLAYLVASF